MARDSTLDKVVSYGVLAGGAYVVYAVGLQGGFGKQVQHAMFDICKSIFGPQKCAAQIADAGSKPPQAPVGSPYTQIISPQPGAKKPSGGYNGNPNFWEQVRVWQFARQGFGEDPCDWAAFVAHLTVIDAPHPGNSPPAQFC